MVKVYCVRTTRLMSLREKNSVSDPLKRTGHALLHPFTSGTIVSDFAKASLEAAALSFLVYGLFLGFNKFWSFSACSTLCFSPSKDCCLSHPGFILWAVVSTLGIWIWTYISCSLKREKLVPTSLVNSVMMIILLSVWLYTSWHVLTFLTLEVLLFLSSYYGYLRAVRRKRKR